MNTLESLYFPDTVLTADGPSALFLLFCPVHVLQPVETAETPDPVAGFPDTFMDAGFCQVHTPAPLGPDRDRFLRLIRDIRSRKDDYAAQLSTLTLASLSAPRHGSDETRHEIIASLFGAPESDPAAEKKELTRQAELWQARLVLAIAEILDREEAEIAAAMRVLGKSEAALFDRLLGKEGEQEDDEELLPELEKLREQMDPPRPGATGNRLKAWLSIYGSQKPRDWWLWVTTRPEAADILLEMFEKKTGEAAIAFWQMELPAELEGEASDHEGKIRAFQEDARPLLREITSRLNDLARREIPAGTAPAALLAEGGTLAEQWAALLATHFPAQHCGRRRLRFHLLASQPFPELAAGDPATADSGIRNGILAVVG